MSNNVSRIGAALTSKGGSTNIAVRLLRVRAEAAFEAYKRALDASPSNSPDNLTLDHLDQGKPTQKKDP